MCDFFFFEKLECVNLVPKIYISHAVDIKLDMFMSV